MTQHLNYLNQYGYELPIFDVTKMQAKASI